MAVSTAFLWACGGAPQGGDLAPPVRIAAPASIVPALRRAAEVDLSIEIVDAADPAGRRADLVAVAGGGAGPDAVPLGAEAFVFAVRGDLSIEGDVTPRFDERHLALAASAAGAEGIPALLFVAEDDASLGALVLSWEGEGDAVAALRGLADRGLLPRGALALDRPDWIRLVRRGASAAAFGRLADLEAAEGDVPWRSGRVRLLDWVLRPAPGGDPSALDAVEPLRGRIFRPLPGLDAVALEGEIESVGAAVRGAILDVPS